MASRKLQLDREQRLTVWHRFGVLTWEHRHGEECEHCPGPLDIDAERNSVARVTGREVLTHA